MCAAHYDDVNPCLLATPASPHLAARHAGISIRSRTHPAPRSADWPRTPTYLIVEGAGGWLAPISALETMGDLAEKLGCPVILVVGLRLGCLNHALLTREAIRSQGLPFAGWIANKMALGNAARGREYRHPGDPLRRGSAGHRPLRDFRSSSSACRPGRPKSPKSS